MLNIILLSFLFVANIAQAATRQHTENISSSFITDGLTQEVPEYFSTGSHDTTHTTGKATVPAGIARSCGDKGCELSLTLTCPKKTQGTPTAAYPLLVVLGGSTLPSAYYKPYVRNLASWGYAVLQYDIPGWVGQRAVADDDEVRFWPVITGWAKDLSRQPGSVVYETLDMRRVGVVGHGRGAKLAALLAAGGTPDGAPAPAATVLIDPVDISPQTMGLDSPSAVDALTAQPRAMAVIGAGVTGWCNPPEEGWAKFWPVLLPGSWLQVLPDAGHMQFTDAKGPAMWIWDKLCGTGRRPGTGTSHKPIIQWTAAAAVAWMESMFRGSEVADLQDRYLAFVQQQAEEGLVQFQIKRSDTTDQ